MQVDHYELRVEVEPRRGGTVEHALQRPFAQILKGQRRSAGVGSEPVLSGPQLLSHLRDGVK